MGSAGYSVREQISAPAIIYNIKNYGPDGSLKWEENVHNLVMTAGKTDLVNQYLKGVAYTATWYLLLIGTGAISATDTLASHPGWAEQSPYTGTRPLITWGTTTAGSNTASAVVIPITAAATIAGAGICSVTSGTGGVLYSASDFASSRTVGAGDTMNITPTISVS